MIALMRLSALVEIEFNRPRSQFLVVDLGLAVQNVRLVGSLAVHLHASTFPGDQKSFLAELLVESPAVTEVDPRFSPFFASQFRQNWKEPFLSGKSVDELPMR